MEKFQKMSDCMAQYPDLYPEAKDDGDEVTNVMDAQADGSETNSSKSATS